MANKIKTVAVYCGHQFGANPNFVRDAEKIGELLGKNGLNMVFGGGDVGLMGATATAALENGAHVMGVSTHNVLEMQEPAHADIEVQIAVGVNERKQRMFELSDAFIILPGGIGTLNELTDIMTMQQIGESKKPLFFMNTSNFWMPFGKLFMHMRECGFIADVHAFNLHVADTAEELIAKVLEY